MIAILPVTTQTKKNCHAQVFFKKKKRKGVTESHEQKKDATQLMCCIQFSI